MTRLLSVRFQKLASLFFRHTYWPLETVHETNAVPNGHAEVTKTVEVTELPDGTSIVRKTEERVEIREYTTSSSGEPQPHPVPVAAAAAAVVEPHVVLERKEEIREEPLQRAEEVKASEPKPAAEPEPQQPPVEAEPQPAVVRSLIMIFPNFGNFSKFSSVMYEKFALKSRQDILISEISRKFEKISCKYSKNSKKNPIISLVFSCNF